MIFGDQENYYRFHSAIYDLSRWTFLFGRKRLTNSLPEDFAPRRILDFGSGTGFQLEKLLLKYPDADISGIEPSIHMISKAKKRLKNQSVRLIHGTYDDQCFAEASFDLITASYALTMIPEPVQAIEKIYSELKTDGILAIADFHDTPSELFRKWMQANHVTFFADYFDQIIPEKGFKIISKRLRIAYGGIWTYSNILYRKL